jgi:hypothetical protein
MSSPLRGEFGTVAYWLAEGGSDRSIITRQRQLRAQSRAFRSADLDPESGLSFIYRKKQCMVEIGMTGLENGRGFAAARSG